MNRWSAIFVLSLGLIATASAQDANGEYSKAMDAYKAYDYDASCRRLTNFYSASNHFHDLREDVLASVRQSGRTAVSLNQSAMQAENAREEGKACSDRYLLALELAIDDDWGQVEKALLAAENARQAMIDQSTPGQHHANKNSDEQVVVGDSSMAAIVAASKGVNSGGGCASEDKLRTDAKLNALCVNHLMTLARKQKRAGQKTIARINYKRAAEVNAYMGKKQNLAVKQESASAVRTIDREQHLQP